MQETPGILQSGMIEYVIFKWETSRTLSLFKWWTSPTLSSKYHELYHLKVTNSRRQFKGHLECCRVASLPENSSGFTGKSFILVELLGASRIRSVDRCLRRRCGVVLSSQSASSSTSLSRACNLRGTGNLISDLMLKWGTAAPTTACLICIWVWYQPVESGADRLEILGWHPWGLHQWSGFFGKKALHK